MQQGISTENIRILLRSLHFQHHRRWLMLNGELNRIYLRQDLVRVLSTIPNFDFAYFNIDQFIQEISDVVVDLQGIDSMIPTQLNSFNTIFLPDNSIELFLDVHVATKLMRFLQHYFSAY